MILPSLSGCYKSIQSIKAPSMMGLGGGSASSSSGSKNGSSTSGTGSPYFQNSNPLNPAAVRPSNNFDFTTAPVPSPSQPIDKGFQPQLGNPNKGNVLTPAGSGFMRDIEQNVEGTRTTALERSLQGATQAYDAAQGEGTVASIQNALSEAERNNIAPTESSVNSVKNMANRLRGFVPRLNIVAADTWENVLGKELTKKWYEFEGRDIDQVRNDAYAELETLRQEALPTLSLTNSIQDGSLRNISAGVVNAFTSLGSTAIPALATGGAGLFTEMTGDALVDFNETKAKRLGVSVDELYKRDQAEFGIPATVGALGGVLEGIGLKGVSNLISKKITGNAFKKAAIFFTEANKEGLTELVQTGLEETNKSLGNGETLAEASKKGVEKMFSKDGLESYLQGVVGSSGVGGIAQIRTVLNTPKAKSSFNDELAKVNLLEMDLAKPEVNEAAKQVIAQEINKSVSNIADIIEQDEVAINKMSDAQKAAANNLNEQIETLNTVINDPSVSEETKSTIQPQIDELTTEIENIKPENKAPQETEIIEVEDNTPDTKQELTDYISQAEEIAMQHEQLAEMETDPVEKEEALEIARNAREVIANSQQQLADLNKETITPKLKTRTGNEEYNQTAARALQRGINESDYKPVDDFEQYFDDKEIFNIAKNSGLKVVVLTPEMAKNNKLLSGATGKFLYNNTIMIDPEYLDKKYYGANILQHEAAHAFTVSVLQEKNDANLQPEEIEFRDEVKKAFNENKNTLFKPYGLTNELEFVAEFYGNPKFRDYLKNENQPLWRKIIKLISGVLKVDNSKLDKIFGDFKQNLLPSEVNIQEAITNEVKQPVVEPAKESVEKDTFLHGSPQSGLTKFDSEYSGGNTNVESAKGGIWVTNNQSVAETYRDWKNPMDKGKTGEIYDVNVDIRNPLYTEDTNEVGRNKAIEQAKENGNDSVVFTDDDGNKQIFIFNPEQATIANKSADTTQEVVTEDLPQKRTEEVLAKAEDDLKALKQVTDKTKKYEASMKRITEAKNNKEISVAEFNDLKKRFDDVIGESKPKVKEEPKDAVQIESTASVDVREPSKDGGEVEQGNAEEQETTRETGSKEVPVTSKEEKKVSEDFRKLVHKNIQSDEVSNTLSNVERETGRELTEEEREYRVTRRNDALNHGANVIEMAKEEFGKTYVSDLLNYLNENASTISLENRALINISLELDLERQLLEDPDNTTLNKQLKLVRDASTKFQRSAAIATGYGILRQIARVGYDINQVTDQFFSEQQLADKAKLTKAIESTPDDINKEAEIQEEDTDPLEDFNIKPKDRKKKFGLTEAQQQEKAELAKQFRGVFNDVTRIATLLADKKFMRYAKLVFLDTAGDFETFAKNMIETVGEGIKKHLPIIYEKVGGTDGVTEKTEAQKQKAKSIKDIVKKALIDKGYGREITVTTNERDEDGKKIKEKRKVLDWKKLAGEEGSVENIKANVESALKNSGYSDSDIELIQQGLTAEYNRLHASIIEKSLNELQSRNQDREPINVKTSAKKLAELYNYGLFDEQSDTYDNIINRALGLSAVGQKAFEEAKVLAKALSDIYRSTDSSGRRISEFGLKDAIRSINAEIERLLTDVAWEQSNMAFKVATVAKEFMGLSQRAMLQTIKQILENPLSGFIQRGFTKIGYSRDGTDTKALSKKRSEAARIVYEDIVRNAGLNYGEIITPFVTRGAFEKKLERLSDNKIYHTALSALLGRAYLDGADSMHKSALTERYFVHNLVRVLVKKGMAKEAAIEFVSNQLTGQKFTDALGSAKQIIDKANEDAGKRIINDNPNAIYRLAQNIVKDALVVGENITLREVESSYKAAYKAAGYDLGHEANNIVSETVAGATTKLENAIKQAVKDKKWNHATALTFTSILTKNIINPFVSGGTNWIVLSLQKAGVDVISPIVDYARQKENKLDLTTKEGVKNMENALLSEMRYKNTINRVVIGAMASTLIAAAAIASGEDDDLAAWLKKNDWAKKYFKVISPQALIVLVARENKQLADYLIGLFGFSYESYSDANKLIQAFQGLSADKKKSQEKGYRKLGEVFGGHTSFPTPWRVARDVENIYRGTQGKKPVKPDYNKGDFWDGYLRNGVIEYFMLER